MILGLVCARYHSQGLPGKNVRPLLGMPLIEWAIEKAMASKCDEVVVSTDIPRSVWSMAVQRIERPEALAGPEVSKWDVWRHALNEHPHADMVVDIDVTRPLTTNDDIDGCIDRLADARDRGTEAVMAIARAKKHPAFDIVEDHQYGVRPYSELREYVARQQLPPVFYHGGVYAVTDEALRTRESFWSCLVKSHEIPADNAWDIDDETDWRIVETLMADRYQGAAR